MAKTIPVIGVDAEELRWLRLLVSLLRHPNPDVPELARQALLYLTETCGRQAAPDAATPDVPCGENLYQSRQNLVS